MISCGFMRRTASRASLLLALPLLGCGLFRHVEVQPLATAAQRPGNVAAYVAVTDGDVPLTELNASNFRVYENDQLVPSDQTQLTLLDPTLVAAHQVVLLVDMSAATTPQAKSVVAKAARNFVQKVTARQAVSVFAFDGGPNLVPIAALPRGDAQVTMAALESFTPRDPSRNLHGAVISGLQKLEMALAQSGKLIRVGTLVVFASGPDIAGRVDSDKAHDAVWESPYDVIGVGVAEQADAVEHFSRRGLVRAQAADTLPIAFEEVADKAVAELDKHYVVSYCSPARAGERRLRLEVTYTNKEGEEHHGNFETDFDAKGFGPGCNSQTVPRFTLVPRTKPEPPKESSKSPGEGGKKPTQPDSRQRDQDGSDDSPVAPPDQSGYAK